MTVVVGVGVATDALAYVLDISFKRLSDKADSDLQNIVVPVLPFRLQQLEYHNISELTSWLLFAYSLGIFLCASLFLSTVNSFGSEECCSLLPDRILLRPIPLEKRTARRGGARAGGSVDRVHALHAILGHGIVEVFAGCCEYCGLVWCVSFPR